MDSNEACEASRAKWTSCLHTCPSAERRERPQVSAEMARCPQDLLPCLKLVSAPCLDKVCLKSEIMCPYQGPFIWLLSLTVGGYSVCFNLGRWGWKKKKPWMCFRCCATEKMYCPALSLDICFYCLLSQELHLIFNAFAPKCRQASLSVAGTCFDCYKSWFVVSIICTGHLEPQEISISLGLNKWNAEVN